MASWGKVLILETIGRRSGRPRRVTIGFVEDEGSLLVAASSEATRWARNLLAQPRCVVELRGSRQAYLARALLGEGRENAIVALIVKYGTPAEQLGAGPAFRLEPHR